MTEEAMKALLTVAVVMILSAAVHAGEPEDFLGMKWGISVDEAKRTINAQQNRRREVGEIVNDTFMTDYRDGERKQKILYRDKFAEARVNIILQFLDQKFVAVTMSFDSNEFSTIDDAFKSQYGKPSNQHQVPLGNAFGGTVIDQRRVWAFKNVEITLMKQADAGGATMQRREWLDYERAEIKNKQAKAAKDL
jgi:hypothetical protein